MAEAREQAEQDEIGSLNFERHSDDRTQLTMLQEALSNMPKIHKISISGPNCFAPPEFLSYLFFLPTFYTRMLSRTCNRFVDTRLEHGAYGFSKLGGAYLAPLIEAARVLPKGLSELDLTEVGLVDMLQHLDYPRSAWMHNRTMSDIRRFRLETMASDSSYRVYLSRIVLMLEQMTQLQDLHLVLRHSTRPFGDESVLVDNSGAKPYLSMITALRGPDDPPSSHAKPLYNGPLQRLTLFGMRVTSQELKAILTPYLRSLEYLSLGDLILVPTAFDSPRACIIRMFKWVQARFSKLKEVHLNGVFSNCGMQQWVVDQGEISTRGIRHDVEKFLVNGGVCPLEMYAIPDGHFDAGIRTFAPGAVSEAYRRLHFDGDDTWYAIAIDPEWDSDEDEEPLDAWTEEDELEEYGWSEDEPSEDEIEDDDVLSITGAGYTIGDPYDVDYMTGEG